MLDHADTVLQGQIDYGHVGVSWDTSHQSEHLQYFRLKFPSMWTRLIIVAAVFRRTLLRMLDNFHGITFLVASRPPFADVNVVDLSAREILSRINASFQYQALDKTRTVKVFELNMRWISDVFAKQHQKSPIPSCLAVEEDILSFATAFYRQRNVYERWNCRQIRKAFSTALALAHADAGPAPAGQSEHDSLEPWKVTLKATHFEAVARSTAKHQPPPPPPLAPPRYISDQPSQYLPQYPPQYPNAPLGQIPPRQMAAPPIPLQQRPQQQTASSGLRRGPTGKTIAVPGEYRRQVHEPVLPPAERPDWVVDNGVQITNIREQGSQGFFLASPLSLEARPELLFMEWEAFKDARVQGSSGCSAIDVLRGEPVVSFDQEAQDSVWWSRWGNRNRAGLSKALDGANTAAVLKEKPPIETSTQSSPLPERIRIHSKYITAILEDIRGSRISKTSFVMVRPYRALIYYEEKIRAKYKELTTKLESSNDDAGIQEQIGEPQAGSKSQPTSPVDVANNRPPGRNVTTLVDRSFASTYASSKSTRSSDNGETIDTSSAISLEHLSCLIEFLDMIEARVKYLSSGDCTKVTFADLWLIYKPGLEVLDTSCQQAYRILSVNSSGHRALPPWRDWENFTPGIGSERPKPTLKLHCVHITFDGKRLGSQTSTLSLNSYEGEGEVSALPVLPLQLVKKLDLDANTSDAGFRQKLIERGKMFVKMTRPTPMHYNGPLIFPKEEADSQVVVDFEQCFAVWSGDPEFKAPVVEHFVGKRIGQNIITPPCMASCCAGESVHNDAYAEQHRNEAYIGSLMPDPEDSDKKPSVAIFPKRVVDMSFEDGELSDEDLVIMSYRVQGFILRSRKWGEFPRSF